MKMKKIFLLVLQILLRPPDLVFVHKNECQPSEPFSVREHCRPSFVDLPCEKKLLNL